MTERLSELQEFIRVAAQTYRDRARDARSVESVARIFAALEQPGEPGTSAPSELPGSVHLDQAMRNAAADPGLAALVDALSRIRHGLTWRASSQKSDASTASANFTDGHANAMIAGPAGLEQRSDIWLGVTVLAPNVRHPDHQHGPEEVYLCLSDGEFLQGDGDWFAPGLGGVFYNEPHAVHAMRSHDQPLLALWAL